MTVCAEKHVNSTHSDAANLLNEIEQRLDALLPVEGERDFVGAAMREGALAPGNPSHAAAAGGTGSGL